MLDQNRYKKMKKVMIYIVLFLIAIVGSYFYYLLKVEDIKHEIYTNQSIELKKTIDEKIEENKGKTAAITYLLSLEKNLISALLSKDNSLIDYSSIIKGIETQTGYKNLWIQIIDNKGYSFYRSWKKNVG